MPRVTLAIPVKNRADLVGATLESLRRQTFHDWVAVVVDDGSTDGTLAVLQEIAEHEPRVRVLCNTTPTPGAPTCRNLAMRSADGEYLMFLDSDDLLAPTALAARVADLEHDASMDCVIYGTELFTSAPGDLGVLFNTCTAEDPLYRFLLYDFPWTVSGPLWRRVALEGVAWHSSLSCGQDVDFHTQLLIRGIRHRVHSRVDHYYRKHPGPGTVGSDPWSLAKLPAHEERLARARGWMCERAESQPARWRALWASMHWIARRWIAAGCDDRGWQMWDTLADDLPPNLQSLGRRMLSAQTPRTRDLLSKSIRAQWPELLTVARSTTLGTTAVVPDAEIAAVKEWATVSRYIRAAAAHGLFSEALRASAAAVRQDPTSPSRWRYLAGAVALRVVGGSRLACGS